MLFAYGSGYFSVEVYVSEFTQNIFKRKNPLNSPKQRFVKRVCGFVIPMSSIGLLTDAAI
jgi:hypothetical protein